MLASRYCLGTHFSLFLYLAGEKQGRERENMLHGNHMACDPTLEVKLHYFCHILLSEAVTTSAEFKEGVK